MQIEKYEPQRSQLEGENLKHRLDLEKCAKTGPKLYLQIMSSATLQKGDVIKIDALGLFSHKSPRTQISTRNTEREQDTRDGFVYFGSKKSVKVN